MKDVLILVVALLIGGPCASAQVSATASSAVQDRIYSLLRDDENWSFLRDQTLRQDFWDPIKYIPLRKNAEDWYITVGGEAREVRAASTKTVLRQSSCVN